MSDIRIHKQYWIKAQLISELFLGRVPKYVTAAIWRF
jgi:hypothetical protein